MSARPIRSVGIVGLGRMGHPIAHHLTDAGFAVVFFDIDEDVGGDLIARGARRATHLGEVASCDASISLLPDRASTLDVVLGHGILVNAATDHLHLLMGTFGPEVVEQAMSNTSGAGIVDCPLSGSVDHARAGTLTALVGATEDQLAMVRPVLSSFTDSIVHVGSAGSASIAKLAINAVVGVTNQAIAEALVLAGLRGLDLERMYDALEASVVSSPFARYKRRHYLTPALPADGPIRQVLKDLDLAIATVPAAEYRIPATCLARHTLAEAAERLGAEADLGNLFQAMTIGATA